MGSMLEPHCVGSSERSKELRQAPKGSLAVHFLVPGMFKGQRDPVFLRRAKNVAHQAVAMLKKVYPCARQCKVTTTNN